MSIIDQIKEAPADSSVIAKFENMRRAGSLSEKQIAYGESLIRAAAPKVSDEAREISEVIAQARRNTPKARKSTQAVAEFTVGQTVTWSGKTGEVTAVQGAGRSAMLVVAQADGSTANVVARFAKAVN